MDAESVNSVLLKLDKQLANWISVGTPDNLKKEMADLSPFVIKQALSMPHNFHEFPRYFSVLQALRVVQNRRYHNGANWESLFRSYMGCSIEEMLPEHAFYYLQGLNSASINSGNTKLSESLQGLIVATKNRKAKGIMKSEESASFVALLFFLQRTSKGKWSTGELVRLIKRMLPKLFFSVEKAKGVQDAMKDLSAIGLNRAFDSLLFLAKEPLTKKNTDPAVFSIPTNFPLSLHLTRCCNVNDKQSLAIIDSYYSKRINGILRKFNWSSTLQLARKSLFKDDKDKINITVHMFHLLETIENAPYTTWYDKLQHYVDKFPDFLFWGRSKAKLIELEKIKNMRFKIDKREANYNPTFDEAKEMSKDGQGFLFLSTSGQMWWVKNQKFYSVSFHHFSTLGESKERGPLSYNPNTFLLDYRFIQVKNFFGFIEMLLHYQKRQHTLVVTAGPFDNETPVNILGDVSVLWFAMPNFYSHINKEINDFVSKFPRITHTSGNKP